MAVNAGVRVIATTRNRDRFAMLEKLGATRCEVERRDLSKYIPEAKKIDAVLDLVGNTVMLDSLAMLRRGGRSCLAGWLGGLDPIPDFNPLLQMASGGLSDFFRQLRIRDPGLPALGCASTTNCRGCRGRSARYKALQNLPFRGNPRSPSRDGGERGQRKNGRGPRLRHVRAKEASKVKARQHVEDGNWKAAAQLLTNLSVSGKTASIPMPPIHSPLRRRSAHAEKVPQAEQFEVLVLGSGTGGKLLAWHMAQSRTSSCIRRP
jgi:Zinc-binding dehydrogenase